MIFKSPFAITEGDTRHLSCKLARCLRFSCMCECVCVNAHVCCRCERETEMGEAGRERRRRSRRGNMWRYDPSLPWNVLLWSLQVHLPSPCFMTPVLTWAALSGCQLSQPASSIDGSEVLEEMHQPLWPGRLSAWIWIGHGIHWAVLSYCITGSPHLHLASPGCSLWPTDGKTHAYIWKNLSRILVWPEGQAHLSMAPETWLWMEVMTVGRAVGSTSGGQSMWKWWSAMWIDMVYRQQLLGCLSHGGCQSIKTISEVLYKPSICHDKSVGKWQRSSLSLSPT